MQIGNRNKKGRKAIQTKVIIIPISNTPQTKQQQRKMVSSSSTSKHLIRLLLQLCIITYLTNTISASCDSSEEYDICEKCVLDDCCHNSNSFAVCSFCDEHPGTCDERAKPAVKRDDREVELEQEMSLPYIPPQRRAKYFLGKRSSSSIDDRIFELYDELEKRQRPFLGIFILALY